MDGRLAPTRSRFAERTNHGVENHQVLADRFALPSSRDTRNWKNYDGRIRLRDQPLRIKRERSKAWTTIELESC